MEIMYEFNHCDDIDDIASVCVREKECGGERDKSVVCERDR